MDHRKIQVTGDGTYTISLPKSWVRKKGLGRGDAIAFVERGDEIALRSGEGKPGEFRVKVSTDDAEFLSRLLITKYIQGYDSVVFYSDEHIDSSIRKSLVRSSDYLIGLELLGEGRNMLSFRMVVSDGGDMLECLGRMHGLSLLSLKELIGSMESGVCDDDVLDVIIDRDNEIDKLYFHILRLLSCGSGYEPVIWAQVTKGVERISDHIEDIAALAKGGQRIRRQDAVVFGQLVDLYADVFRTLQSGDMRLAEEILIKVQRFRADGANLKNSLRGDDRKSIMAYAGFTRIGEYISDLAESAINLS